MPPLHTWVLNHEMNRPLLHIHVIGSYYEMTIMDENVNWTKLAHLFSNFPTKLRAIFVNLHVHQTY